MVNEQLQKSCERINNKCGNITRKLADIPELDDVEYVFNRTLLNLIEENLDKVLSAVYGFTFVKDKDTHNE